MECQGPRLTPETASVLAEGQSLRLLRLALRLGAVAEATGLGRESRFTVPEQCTEGRTGLVRMEPARLPRAGIAVWGQQGEEAGRGGTQSSPGDGGGWPSGDRALGTEHSLQRWRWLCRSRRVTRSAQASAIRTQFLEKRTVTRQLCFSGKQGVCLRGRRRDPKQGFRGSHAWL